MKNVLALLVFVLCFAGLTRAEDSKYVAAMKNNLAQMDSMKTVDSMVEISNAFLRIAEAEKTKWLPYYYSSLVSILTSMSGSEVSKKDFYLDQAEKALAIADSLQSNESEIYVLKGFLCAGRLQVDPMNRYMKFLPEMNSALDKAMVLDPTNPRPEYLKGTSIYFTPEQFGGGAKAALPVFQSSLKKFDEFVPKEELMPNWGKEQLLAVMKQLPQ